jgi:hypothetical protein
VEVSTVSVAAQAVPGSTAAPAIAANDTNKLERRRAPRLDGRAITDVPPSLPPSHTTALGAITTVRRQQSEAYRAAGWSQCAQAITPSRMALATAAARVRTRSFS